MSFGFLSRQSRIVGAAAFEYGDDQSAPLGSHRRYPATTDNLLLSPGAPRGAPPPA